MSHPLMPVVLGPVRLGQRSVTLRPGRPEDFADWRRIRLRDEAAIAPFWVSDGSDWDGQHTEAIWLRKLVEDRARARAGNAACFVVELDGRFAGQVELTGIDDQRHAAEIGIWIDSEVSGQLVGALVGALGVDFAFEIVGIRRVTAPVSVQNRAATICAQRWGMREEATMRSYLEVGGGRLDHRLWTVLADDHPTAAVCRVLDSPGTRSMGPLVPVHRPRLQLVVPRSPSAVLVLGRHAAGTIRQRLVAARHRDRPAVVVPTGTGLEIAHALAGSATLRVGPDLPTASELRSYLRTTLATGDVHRVVTTTSVEDEGLAAVLDSAGMRREGIMRAHRDLDGRVGDHVLWSVVSSDTDVAV